MQWSPNFLKSTLAFPSLAKGNEVRPEQASSTKKRAIFSALDDEVLPRTAAAEPCQEKHFDKFVVGV